MARMGRPPIVLDDLRQKRIVDAARAGLSVRSQAARGSISASLLKEWLQAGRAGEERFVDFVARVEAARADYEQSLLDTFNAGCREDPVKAMGHVVSVMKARFPETYDERMAATADALASINSDESDTSVLESLLAASKSRKSA